VIDMSYRSKVIFSLVIIVNSYTWGKYYNYEARLECERSSENVGKSQILLREYVSLLVFHLR